MLLAVDDAHWADEPSLRFLAYLARHVESPIALQLMHASPTGDEVVVSELRLAAERARARGAPGSAVALLRRALAEPPATAARADLLLALGQAEYAVRQSGEATAHLVQAQRAATDPRHPRARAVQTLPGQPRWPAEQAYTRSARRAGAFRTA